MRFALLCTHRLNVYIPLLPLPLLDVLGSPVPYLLGVSADTLDEATLQGALPDDALIVRLDRSEIIVPHALDGLLPTLPDTPRLVAALEAFRHGCPPAPDEAAQADLAFPLREHGAAAREAAARDRAQLQCRHAFASWWAQMLHGYQDHLRTGTHITASANPRR